MSDGSGGDTLLNDDAGGRDDDLTGGEDSFLSLSGFRKSLAALTAASLIFLRSSGDVSGDEIEG